MRIAYVMRTSVPAAGTRLLMVSIGGLGLEHHHRSTAFLGLVVVWGVTFVVFMIVHIVPGDPARVCWVSMPTKRP
jgi:ABC-type dipeptide/oligopeptide/nickel transport system permease component